MAASDVLPPDNPLPDLLRRVGFRRRRGGYGSATQLLWNKLESDASLHALCQAREDLTDEDRVLLKQCEDKLEVARRCLDKPTRRWSFSFWQVIHEVDGLLLLVLPRHMLLPTALDIQQQFERRVTDATQSRLWLGANRIEGPLPQCVLMLSMDRPVGASAALPPLFPGQLAYCRHVLRGALGVINEQVDKTFWQLSINVSIQIFSTTLLLALFFIAFQGFSPSLVHEWPMSVVPMGMLVLSLAGAAGAVLSNMLSKQRFVVATGATSRYFAYHLLVKPVIGGFAALMLLFLEQSQLLLSVVIRPEAETSAQAQAPAADTGPAGAAEPDSDSRPPEPTGDDNNPAVLHIHVSSRQAAFFTMAALAVVAGYSADRLLSSVMDSVLGRLLRQSEKLLPPSAPPGTPPTREEA